MRKSACLCNKYFCIGLVNKAGCGAPLFLWIVFNKYFFRLWLITFVQ